MNYAVDVESATPMRRHELLYLRMALIGSFPSCPSQSASYAMDVAIDRQYSMAESVQHYAFGHFL